MSALTREDWPTVRQGDDTPHRETLAVIIFAVIGLMNSLCLLLVVRRLGGAFSDDLPRSMLFLTAVISVAIAATSRIVWRQLYPLDIESPKPFSWGDQIVGWGSSLVPLLMMVGTCFPGNRISDWLIWLPLVVCDQFWRQNFFDGGHPEYQAGISTLAEPQSDANGPTNEQSAPDCTQQIFRVREPDGLEAIYATLQVDFQVGQRHATAYVGFCPPLPYRPVIEADPYEGPQTEVKVVQALSHGVRIDLKLATATDHPLQVLVDLAARSPHASDG